MHFLARRSDSHLIFLKIWRILFHRESFNLSEYRNRFEKRYAVTEIWFVKVAHRNHVVSHFVMTSSCFLGNHYQIIVIFSLFSWRGIYIRSLNLLAFLVLEIDGGMKISPPPVLRSPQKPSLNRVKLLIKFKHFNTKSYRQP